MEHQNISSTVRLDISPYEAEAMIEALEQRAEQIHADLENPAMQPLHVELSDIARACEQLAVHVSVRLQLQREGIS